jgi:zinc protease
MMFRKTNGYPEGNYDKIINSIGGSGNAGTSESFVTFYSKFPSPALETMLELESQRFLNLEITEPYFSIEKGAVISERRLRVENNPIALSEEKLRARVEKGTQLEWMTIGSKDDVMNMSLSTAKQFYENFYTPDNTLIVIGGPFKPLEVASLVDKYFGSWDRKHAPAHKPYPDDYETRNLGKNFVDVALVQTQQLQIVYPSKQNNLQSYVNSLLFQSMLDDSDEGTFSLRLVKKNIATEFSFYQSYWQNQSFPFLAQFSLSKEQNFQKARAFWLDNVTRVLMTPLSDKIKKQVLKQITVNNAEISEKMTSLVSSILDNFYFLHEFHAAHKIESLIQETTETQFKTWIKQNLNESSFYTTEISSKDKK